MTTDLYEGFAPPSLSLLKIMAEHIDLTFCLIVCHVAAWLGKSYRGVIGSIQGAIIQAGYGDP